MQLIQPQYQQGAEMRQTGDWIRGLGSPNLSSLEGFEPGMQAFNQLMGFNPQVSDPVRGALTDVMQNPFGPEGGVAQNTLNEMLETGAPTDVSGITDAAGMRGSQMMREMGLQSQERAALRGGLSGSGADAAQNRALQAMLSDLNARSLEAGVGAQEAATGRRGRALDQFLGGRGLSANAAGTLGNLEGQATGQRLGALTSAGGLESAASGQRLSRDTSIANMLQRGQISQAGMGLDMAKFLETMGQGGGMGMTKGGALSFMNAAARGYGGTMNDVAASGARQRWNLQKNMMKFMEQFRGGAGNPTSASGGRGAAASSSGTSDPAKSKFHRMAEKPGGSRKVVFIGGKAFETNPRTGAATSSFGSGTGNLSAGGKFGSGVRGTGMGITGGLPHRGPGSGGGLSSPEEFRAWAKQNEANNAAAKQRVAEGGSPYTGGWGSAANNPAPAATDPNFANYWTQYSQQFVNPAAYTAGGVPVGG
jgi:hypothetical protein